jgi:hypothetical protein
MPAANKSMLRLATHRSRVHELARQCDFRSNAPTEPPAPRCGEPATRKTGRRLSVEIRAGVLPIRTRQDAPCRLPSTGVSGSVRSPRVQVE